jgi:DNA modification methylase
MQIETIAVDRLIPYARNSRTHSDAQVAQIAASLREYGFTNPVLIDKDGGIIAGHGRTLAALQIGLTEVPCIRLPHLSDAQKRAYIIADNKLALNAGWDESMLALELRELKEIGYNVGLTGFDDKEIDALLASLDEEPGLTDPENCPETQTAVITQPGDVWQMGNHRLMCGDSTSSDDVATLMHGRFADLVWTDPPYNVAVQGKAGSIMNDSMSGTDFRAFMADVYARYNEAMRPGAVIYVAHAETERVSFTEQLVAAGLKLSQTLIWVKQSATLSRNDFNWRHEPILYGWKEGAAHYFCGDFTRTTVIEDDIDYHAMKKPDLIALLKATQAQKPDTTLYCDRPTKSELHPTMKPVALVQKMIEWSSHPGNLVLDLFGGSGTTLIASTMTARQCYMMELDPKYADVIVRRWQQFTGKTATHESTGEAFPE